MSANTRTASSQRSFKSRLKLDCLFQPDRHRIHSLCDVIVLLALYQIVFRLITIDLDLRRFSQRRSQEFDLGGYKLHDIEFVLGQGDKTTT